MTKFERVGVNRQYDATTLEEARKSFRHSCECCCHKGMHIDCDRCAIAYTHNLIVAYFNDKETSK
jgi:hypothetical protein